MLTRYWNLSWSMKWSDNRMRPWIFVDRLDCSPATPCLSTAKFATESANEHIAVTTTEHQDSTTILGGTNPPKDAPGMNYTWTIGTPSISDIFAPTHFTIKLFFDGHVEVHDLVNNVTHQDNDSHQPWELCPPPEFTPPDSSILPIVPCVVLPIVPSVAPPANPTAPFAAPSVASPAVPVPKNTKRNRRRRKNQKANKKKEREEGNHLLPHPSDPLRDEIKLQALKNEEQRLKNDGLRLQAIGSSRKKRKREELEQRIAQKNTDQQASHRRKKNKRDHRHRQNGSNQNQKPSIIKRSHTSLSSKEKQKLKKQNRAKRRAQNHNNLSSFSRNQRR